jgi:hypothetical protein
MGSVTMALGMIKDANPNPNAIDVYALVISNTVVNMIVASYNEILAIYKSYDYCVDVTMQGQQPGPGWSYNGSEDQFTAPPPPSIDWVGNVQGDFDAILSDISQCVNDAGSNGGSLTPQQINAAYNSALNDNPDLDAATLTLFQTIYEYILAGG